MLTHIKRQLLLLLQEAEDLHTIIRDGDGQVHPAAIDHSPYEFLHDADVEGECPVCKAILLLHQARELIINQPEDASPTSA